MLGISRVFTLPSAYRTPRAPLAERKEVDSDTAWGAGTLIAHCH